MKKLETIILPIIIFTIISSASSNNDHQTHDDHDQDESTLLALKAHILVNNSQDIILAKNWSERTPFCSWVGVSCGWRHPFRVTVLNLSYMGLQGTIPEEIGNLSFLSHLNVENNSFSGTIPDTIGKLIRLRKLFMRNNSFSGHIPPTIGRLTRLEILSIAENQLTGAIPTTIFTNLSSLLGIYLYRNKLSGMLPQLDVDYHLTKLQVLDLTDNLLTGTLPQDMICSRLPNLRELWLSKNLLSGEIPWNVSACGELEILSLSLNNFSGSIPVHIGNLSRLHVLYFGRNLLSGTLPNIDYRLPNLRELDLSDNQLTGTLPSTIFNISSLLEKIFLHRNQFFGTLSGEDMICSHLPNLRELWLSKNRLNGSIPSTITACGELEVLSLSFNDFGGIIPVHIGNLSRLHMLYLSRNRLTGVIPTSIGNLSNLEELTADENSLYGTIPSEIGRLSNLTWLSFGQQNKLSGKIPYTLFNLSKMRTLSFERNELSGELPPSISIGLPNLIKLYIWGNRLSGTIPLSLSNLSQLTQLDLGNNLFSGHIPISLGNLPQLQALRLEANQFTNNLSIPEQDFISPLTDCMFLSVIKIEGNLITGELPRSLGTGNLSKTLEQFTAFSCQITGKIPNELGNISSLIWLGIAANKLVGAIPESFSSLINLQRLTLSNNMLQGSIPHSFCNMKSLYLMSFSRNILSGQLPLCLGNLSSLREIYLSHNAFNSNIPSTLWFSSSIEVLNLANNFFTGTLPRNIGSLKSARELDLSNNRLFGNIPESFSEMKELHCLDLSHNNLSGEIPKSLESLPDLHCFNVSFNELSGEIPNEGPFKNFTPEFFIANKGLCGDSKFKVEACERNKPKNGSSIRFSRYILPPVLGFSICVAAALLLFVIRYRARKSSSTPSLSNLPIQLSIERISYYEVLRATNNLDESNLIGRGSFSSVYKGEFSDVVIAAIKIFNLEVQSSLKSFDTECMIMRNIRHRNLVKVITACSNLDFKALIMEYMPNGNLNKWLHSTEYSLNISQRLGVMIDVATAVEYLHHGYSSPIIHCDLKPSNILLDSDMVAHVGDFGISKLLSREQAMLHTKTLGTIGYMASEYGSGGLVSTAVDVYSYGIVLMETFTRKKPTDEMFTGELTLKRWVSESFPNTLMQIVDADLTIINEGNVRCKYEKCLTSIIGLALECTTDIPEQRPNMKDVLVRIKKIKYQL